MKKILKILFFALFLSINFEAFSYYIYPYVCDDATICSSTSEKEINKTGYFLKSPILETINNFGIYLDEKLSFYRDEYDGLKIEIEYKFNGEYVIKEFTFDEILGYSKIDVKGIGVYDSGKDYLFSNFSDVVNAFNDKLQYHGNRPDSSLKALHENILGYSNKKFEIKRICENSGCKKSVKKSFTYNSNDRIFLLTGGIPTENEEFGKETLDIEPDYDMISYYVKAGDNTGFHFSFSTILGDWSDYMEFKYNVARTGSNMGYFEEIIRIDKNFNITAKDIDGNFEPLSDLGLEGKISLKKFGRFWGGEKIEITIDEPMTLTIAGDVYFSMDVNDELGGFNKSVSMLLPVVISPNDNLSNTEAIFSDSDFNKIKSSGIRLEDTLNISLVLKDKYGNRHCDRITNGGYNVFFSSLNTTKDAFEISVTGKDGTWKKDGIIVLSDSKNANCTVNFKIRAIKTGFFKVGFNLKTREKDAEDEYKKPENWITASDDVLGNNQMPTGEMKIKEIIPKQIENGALIYVKASGGSDVKFSCTNGNISIYGRCDSDNFSGCRGEQRQTINFDSEADNGRRGSIIIFDNANNRRSYEYLMDHIDKTPPTFKLFRDGVLLNQDLSTYTYKASDKFLMEVFEKTTKTCIDNASITFSIKNIDNGETKQINVNSNTNNVEKIEDFSNYGIKYVLNLSEWLTKAGSWEITIKDKYGNQTTKKIRFTIYPTDEGLFEGNNTNFWSLKVDGNGNKFANNSDSYLYTLTLKDKFGNPIYGKTLPSIEQDYTSVTGLKTICLDDITKNCLLNNYSNTALSITYDNKIGSKANGEFIFNLKSYVPGEFSQYFKATMSGWNDNYQDTGTLLTVYPHILNTNTFKKPVQVSDIKISNTGEYWTANPEIGKDQYYKITLNNTGTSINISNGNLDINKYSVVSSVSGHVWGKFEDVVGNFGNSLSKTLSFIGNMDANSNVLSGPKIATRDLKISYTIGEKDVTYYLDDFDKEGSCENKSTLGVKVQGSIQSDGKGSLTGQQENFSDLTTSTIRNNIRKEAYTLVKGLKSGNIVNGVRYEEGNVIIGGEIGDLGYETLVVKNGNVIINGNLNPNGKKLGIIVLRDGYNIATDWNKYGNIYVKNSVKKINAIIYADGALRSANEEGIDYKDSQLLEQLELNGSLFTRNTIGGAIIGGTSRTLPGGANTDDYELASRYDLNYVRKTPICEPEDYSFLIKYDPRVQTDSPKGFVLN